MADEPQEAPPLDVLITIGHFKDSGKLGYSLKGVDVGGALLLLEKIRLSIIHSTQADKPRKVERFAGLPAEIGKG